MSDGARAVGTMKDPAPFTLTLLELSLVDVAVGIHHRAVARMEVKESGDALSLLDAYLTPHEPG